MTRSRRPVPPLLALLTLLAGLVVATPVAAREPMALGLSEPDGRDPATLQASIDRYGTEPAAWTLWSQWGHRGGHQDCYPETAGSCAFPRAAADHLAERGIVPIVWWEPVQPARPQNGLYPRYQNILDGEHDNYIARWAVDARNFGRAHGTKTILRFAHEVNGKMFPWGVDSFDNTPERFKKAWRYVWRVFRDQGALQYVDFMWSVAKQSCSGCNPYAKVYPGDAYVDWVAVSAYNWGTRRSWKPLENVLEKPMKDLWQVAKKPVVIIEIGSNEEGGDRAEWIRTGYQDVYERWGRIKGLVYLDTDQPKDTNDHPDWSLARGTDDSSVWAYRLIAADARFKGTLR
jgi:hypothetical protein